MNILFLLTGSIAAYKACDAISQLVQRGHSVRAVATPAALRFVGVPTLEALTRQKVGTDLFAPGEALDHITLARWADVTVVCPATANTLNAMAAGLADDFVGALLLAHEWKKPLLVAPAMNPAMWQHPATVASVTRLREWGVRFIAPGAGRTACGEVGEGRLAEPEEIVAAIESASRVPARRLRVLVTSGGTTEPIDGVRVLTNTSTGETGARIAAQFAAAGHDVVLLRAVSAVPVASAGVREVVFTTFAELDAALRRELGGSRFDAVVHAAAVSDFGVAAIEVNGATWTPGMGKMPSDHDPVIRLRRHPKLLEGLRGLSANRDVRVVGFKLTREATPAAIRSAVQAQFATHAVDFVVQNDLAWRTPDAFPADIWTSAGESTHCADRADIAPALEALLLASVPAAAESARV